MFVYICLYHRVLYHRQKSTEEIIPDMISGKSLMNNKNNSGPSIEPCGTPHVTVLSVDITLLIETTCFLLVKYERNQLIALSLHLYISIF